MPLTSSTSLIPIPARLLSRKMHKLGAERPELLFNTTLADVWSLTGNSSAMNSGSGESVIFRTRIRLPKRNLWRFHSEPGFVSPFSCRPSVLRNVKSHAQKRIPHRIAEPHTPHPRFDMQSLCARACQSCQINPLLSALALSGSSRVLGGILPS